jgi:voltage-gated potassium channel
MTTEQIGYGDAVLKVFPSFLGEIGEIGDPNLAVRISIIFGLLASISFIVVITGKITSVLVDFLSRGGSMVNKVNFSNHTIICGWNFQGKQIVKDLLEADTKNHNGIVVLADCEKIPINESRIVFVKGNPSNDEDLRRVGITKACNVIVLTDFT